MVHQQELQVLLSIGLDRRNHFQMQCLQLQRWFDFDPHMDVHISDFVGVQSPESAQQNGELFWVAKVRELRNVAREDGEFLALWYWPT
jgi:hypothetical protein